MSALNAASRYFDAWNARDSAAVLASLTPGGTYADPTTGGPISGAALKANVEALWAAFPDLSFEIVSEAETGGGRVAAEWVMRGTNSGPFRGLPPTGKAITLPGSDFIDTEGGLVSAVRGYFDGGTMLRQLGLQVVVQPYTAGAFAFGTSIAVQSGRTAAPGAFSITQLEVTGDAMAEEVRAYSRTILAEMLDDPAFIGATTARIGPRMVTISAWTDTQAPAAFMRKGAHAEAMKPFYKGNLGVSAYTSVWTPERINPYWVRCDACGRMAKSQSDAACTCGAALPAHPPYW